MLLKRGLGCWLKFSSRSFSVGLKGALLREVSLAVEGRRRKEGRKERGNDRKAPEIPVK